MLQDLRGEKFPCIFRKKSYFEELDTWRQHHIWYQADGFDVSGVEAPEKVSGDFLTTLRGEKFNIPLTSKPQIFNGGSLLFDVRLLSEGNISEPRNPLLIRAFRALNLAEEIGSGFVKIFDGWKAANFAIPEVVSDRRNNFCRLTFSFKKSDGTAIAPAGAPENSKNPPVKEMSDLKSLELKILDLVSENQEITYDELASTLKINRDTVRVYMNALKGKGFIERLGSDKTGKWSLKIILAIISLLFN